MRVWGMTEGEGGVYFFIFFKFFSWEEEGEGAADDAINFSFSGRRL